MRHVQNIIRLLIPICAIFLSHPANADGDCQTDSSCPQQMSEIIVSASGGCEGYCGGDLTFADFNFEFADYAPAIEISWSDPASPRCGNETSAANSFAVRMAFSVASGGPPPGTVIMNGPFGDPAFVGPDWKKYDYQEVFRVAQPNGLVTRYSVHIHYMFNEVSRNFNQVRFKSSFEAACVGSTTSVGT